MAVRWAARRAAAYQAGSDGAAWLDGTPARAMACDASVIPVVTGGIDPAALDDLVGLCLQYAGHGPHCGSGPDPDQAARRPIGLARRGNPAAPARLTGQASPAAPARPARQASPRTRRLRTRLLSQARPRARPYPARGRRGRRRRRCSGRRSSAGPSTWSRAPAASPASCGPGRWAPGWPGQPAAGRRAQRRDPRRHPPRGHPARPALPLGRRLRPARQCLRSPPRHPPGRRRHHQRRRLRAVLLFPPPRSPSTRWGWTVALHPDGTTTARSPDGTKTFHSHSPPTARPG